MSDRQRKLQQLLQSEKEAYFRQIAQNAIPESSEARAKRLENEAIELAKRKEAERLRICEEKLRQKFISENDEIRAENSRLFQLEVAGFQLQQIKEKRERQNACREIEAHVFEYLHQQQYQEQVEREDKERANLEEQREMIRKTLELQIQQKMNEKEKESEIVDGFFIGQNHVRVTTQMRHEPFCDLLERRQQEKEDRINAEKEENRKIVEDLLARERLAVEQEHATKLNRAKMLRQFLEQHTEDQRERREWELEIEKEMEKETAKMDHFKASLLARENEKRQELLSIVMAERNAQVAARQEQISERKEMQRNEKTAVEFQVAIDLASIDAERRKKKEVKLQYARDLEQQLKMKPKEIDKETIVCDPTSAQAYIGDLKQKQGDVYNLMISPHLEKFD
jgi:hypothetical protein